MKRAFTVCSALGIDTSDYSFPYVASWASGKELKELKDSMDTIRLTAADFLEKLETAVAERSVRMTAMEYAEKLIADKERDKTVFDNSQRNLIVNFAYKLDDRAATEELANNLAAAVAAENTEEINRLMWEAEEKIENLPDGMIGLSEIKSIGFSLEDGSIYSGMFDLMVGGEVQAEIVNHIQHYRESPLVQKAISDMKTLLEKRQASKELEERPSTRQSVREALKNRKKAQEQQSNQEQEKPKKAKKKGEMEL